MNIETKEEEMVLHFKETDCKILSWLFLERENLYNHLPAKNYNDKTKPANVDFFHSSIQ